DEDTSKHIWDNRETSKEIESKKSFEMDMRLRQQQVFEIYIQDQVQGQRFHARLLKIQVASKKVKIAFKNADSSSRIELIPSKIKHANKVVLNFHKE
nr:hypothetical protein [Tanacetum cinerariifolium]